MNNLLIALAPPLFHSHCAISFIFMPENAPVDWHPNYLYCVVYYTHLVRNTSRRYLFAVGYT